MAKYTKIQKTGHSISLTAFPLRYKNDSILFISRNETDPMHSSFIRFFLPPKLFVEEGLVKQRNFSEEFFDPGSQ